MQRKKLNFKSILCVCIVFSVLLSCIGCSSDTKDSEAQTASETSANDTNNSLITTQEDITVEDNSEYYNDLSSDVVCMYLTVRKGNESDNTNYTWKQVNSHSTYYYDEKGIDRYKVEGTLKVGDKNGPVPDQFGYDAVSPNCTVQVRGKTTSRAAQKSYQIKIKKDKGLWDNQRTVILNKHIFDDSRIRNKFTYDLMAKYEELVGQKTTFVQLFVMDLTSNKETYENYGLYTQVEQVNKKYLLNHGLDNSGQLYKASMFEFMQYDALKLTTDEGFDENAFNEILEVKGDDDHTKLLEMLADVNNYAIPIEETVEKYFDEENYFSWLAFQLMIGNSDIVSQNFYLYSPQNGTKWYFIAWDNDGAWSYQSRTESYAKQGYNYMDGLSNLWGVILHKRVLRSSQLRSKLLEKINYFYEELKKPEVTELMNKYAKVAYKYIYQMPDVEYARSKKAEYYNYIKGMQNEVETNYQLILESLDCPLPFYANDPEISGDNILYTWDDSFDFDDEDLTYTIEISDDYSFKKILFKKTTTMTQAESKIFPTGEYFIRLTVENESGKEQTMQYFYEDVEGLKHFGVAEFFIEKGKIVGTLNE